MLRVVYNCYINAKQYPDALRVAAKLGDTTRMHECFTKCDDEYDPSLSLVSAVSPACSCRPRILFSSLSQWF